MESNIEVKNKTYYSLLTLFSLKIIQYLFNEPRTAHISFEGYDNISYQFDVASHSTKLVHKEDGNNFRAIGIMNTDEKTVPALQKHQKANIRIVISNKTLWQQVFG